LLEAAALAAVARNSFGGVDNDVSHLAAAAVGACHYPAADDYAAAHTGAEGKHNGAVIAFAAAQPKLAECGYVGVVACRHVGDRGQKFVHFSLEVKYAPTEVYTAVDNVFGVNRAGNAETYAIYLLGGDAFFAHFFADGIRYIGKNGFAVIFGNSRDLPLFEK